jgi:hypothetical protein
MPAGAPGQGEGGLLIGAGTLAGPGTVTGDVRNAGTVNAAGGTLTINGTVRNAGTLVAAAGGTLAITGALDNFSGTTLAGGTYVIGGTLQFPGADVVTNAAALVLDGPAGQVVDEAGNDALAGLAANAAAGRFTVQNGRTFMTAGDFANAGGVTVGAGSTLAVPGAYTQSVGSTTLAGGVLAAGGLADIRAGTLGGSGTINADVRNAGTLVAGSGGTVTVNGALSQTGMVVVQGQGTLVPAGGGSAGGSFSNEGTLAVAPGTTFTVTGSYTQPLTGTLSVPATATCFLAGPFDNFSGGTLTGGTYLIGGTFRFTGANVLTNAAALVLDGPAAQIVDEAGRDGLAHLANNAFFFGRLTVQGGRELTTDADFTNRGTLTVAAGSTFTVTGRLTNLADGALTGGTYRIAGTLRFTGADVLINAASVTLDGPESRVVDEAGNDALAHFLANSPGAGFIVQNGRSFTTPADFYNGGTLEVGAGSAFVINGALSNLVGTTLTGGIYVLAGTLQWAGANVVTNSAVVLLTGPAGRVVDEAGQDGLARLADNSADGTLDVLSGSSLATAGDFSNDGYLAVGAGSTFTVNGTFTQHYGGDTDMEGGVLAACGLLDIQWGFLSGAGTVHGAVRNAGTVKPVGLPAGDGLILDGDLTQVAGGTTSLTYGPLTVTGAFTQAGGSIELDRGSLTVGGLLDLQGGTLSGPGTINGAVRNAAQVSVGARLTIHGDYTQTADGTLTVFIGGTQAGSQYSQLTVTGHATLDGTLAVQLVQGFTPAPGDAFQVLLSGSADGTFAQLTGDGDRFSPLYLDTGLTLVAN